MKIIIIIKFALITFIAFLFFNSNKSIRNGEEFDLNRLHFLTIANAEGSGSHKCYKFSSGDGLLAYDCTDCVQKRGELYSMTDQGYCS